MVTIGRRIAILVDGPNSNHSQHEVGYRINPAKIPELLGLTPEDEVACQLFFALEPNLSPSWLRFQAATETAGYQFITEARAKDVDLSIATIIFQLIVDDKELTDIVLLSGDGGFVPFLVTAAKWEIRIHIVTHQPNLSGRYQDEIPAEMLNLYFLESPEIETILKAAELVAFRPLSDPEAEVTSVPIHTTSSQLTLSTRQWDPNHEAYLMTVDFGDGAEPQEMVVEATCALLPQNDQVVLHAETKRDTNGNPFFQITVKAQ